MIRKEKKMVREKWKHLEPLLRIGKNGLSEGLIKEIKKMVRVRPLVKIKFLPAALEGKNRKAFGQEAAEKTGSMLVEAVGGVIVLKRKN